MSKAIGEISMETLEEDWVDHPAIFEEWADQLPDAILDADLAEAKFELAKADAEARIRAKPIASGIKGKVTEGAIKLQVVRDKEVQETQLRYFKKKHKQRIIEVALKKCEHRKRALEKLVDLALGEWRSVPVASKKNREKMEEIATKKLRERTSVKPKGSE